MKGLYLVSCLVVMVLVLAGLGACAASTPTATAKPTPSPTSKPASAPSAAPSPILKPTVAPIPASSPTSQPTSSPTSAPVSFAGKTISQVVSSAAGGATDLAARLYAYHLPKFLPGSPNVLVRNMPGGAGTIGGNYFYFAKPDGLTVFHASSSLAIQQLMGVKAVRYDILKMRSLMATSSSALIFMKPGIISKAEDLLKAKGIIYGSSAGGSALLFICSRELLDFPIQKAVLAYPGTGDARRAFLSGEINMTYDNPQAYLEIMAPLEAKGEVLPLFQIGRIDEKGNMTKDPILPASLLTITELYEKLYGKPPSGMAWDACKAVLAAAKAYDDMLLLPPGTPDSVVRAYWDATQAMIKDPTFLKTAGSLGFDNANWMAGETVEKQFRLNIGMDPKVIDWFRSTMVKYGMTVD